MNSRTKSILQALFVVFLWATSWVFIKIGLDEISPLIFAGLRYFLAFLILLVVLLFNDENKEIKNMPKQTWGKLIILGLLFYSGTQGAIFVALLYLPAVTVNLLWSFSGTVVALLGITWLSERPTIFQWGGIGLTVIGALIYFYPVLIPENQYIGIAVSVIGVLTNAVSSIMGRGINRSVKIHPLIVTVVSMGAGSLVLLVTGLFVEGIPEINLKSWLLIIWLAAINTAFAFTLWNHTLRTLTAMESSIINGTMIIWIPLFAILFLGESISIQEIIGLIVVGMGTLIVQLRRIPKTEQTAS
jgi:drug/metabolite transporter (DMT)-like permease